MENATVESAEPRPSMTGGALRTLAIVGGQMFALFFALLGGVLGIGGAAVSEAASGGWLLLPIIGAPIAEELFKPVGIYILVARWPRLLQGQLHTAGLAAISGLAFGLVEAFVYLNLYFPDAADWFVTYRLTIPLALHTITSFIVGLGINRQLLGWANGENAFPKASRDYYIAAIAIHAVFNTAGIVLTLAGTFPEP